jgi:probable rRNA maturation factor
VSPEVEVVTPPELAALEAPVAGLVRATLEAEGVGAAVVVAFVEEEAIALLNRRYRGITGPTDVLSFRYAGEAGARPVLPAWPCEEEGSSAGEIAVCPAVVRRYSEEEGDDPGRRLAWTIVHGVLHLVGYDHETDHGEMRRREQELLLEMEESVLAVAAGMGG